MVSNVSARLLDAARDLGPRVTTCADQIEQDRRLPEPLVAAIAEAGLFKMLVPGALGGSEADPETLLQVVEEVARVDGSAGWNVAVGAAAGVVAGFLPEDVAGEMFANPRACLVGSAVPAPRSSERPPDQALPIDGGFQVTGRWGFTSGCRNATWVLGLCPVNEVLEGTTTNSLRVRRAFLFPIADCRIADTWNVIGLRGTGSHEFAVDAFVPAARSLPSHPVAPRHPGPLYAFAPALGSNGETAHWANATIVAFAAVSLGIARGALDAFGELAGAKPRGKALLRDNPVVQAQMGQAEATLRAARAYLIETIRDLWKTARETGGTTSSQQALLRLAGAHATARASQVVDVAWGAAGTSAIFIGSPFERRFRDIHTLTQNITVSPAHYGGAGQMFLGIERQ
jgi:alkylation response protein AidB-like acyl-CoA dehydrogenase